MLDCGLSRVRLHSITARLHSVIGNDYIPVCRECYK